MIYQGHSYVIENWAVEWPFFITGARHPSFGPQPGTTHPNGFSYHKLHPREDMPRRAPLNIPFHCFCITKLNKMTFLNHSLPSVLPERGVYSGERKVLGPLLEKCCSNTFPTYTRPTPVTPSPRAPTALHSSESQQRHEVVSWNDLSTSVTTPVVKH